MARQVLTPYVHTDGQTWPHFFVDAKSGVIYFMKSHGGKKIKFSTKEKVPNGVRAKRYANIEFDKRIGKNTRFVRSLIKENTAYVFDYTPKHLANSSISTSYLVKIGDSLMSPQKQIKAKPRNQTQPLVANSVRLLRAIRSKLSLLVPSLSSSAYQKNSTRTQQSFAPPGGRSWNSQS